jgi:hypothetical protein
MRLCANAGGLQLIHYGFPQMIIFESYFFAIYANNLIKN